MRQALESMTRRDLSMVNYQLRDAEISYLMWEAPTLMLQVPGGQRSITIGLDSELLKAGNESAVINRAKIEP